MARNRQTDVDRALLAAAGRSAGLLRAAGDGCLQVQRSEWTVGEVGAHLVMGLRAYSLAAMTCLLLGEQLIHGRDVARTLRRPWPISAGEGRLLAGAYPSMLPLAVDPRAAAGMDLSCEIRLRGGGDRIVVRIHDARVEIDGSGAGRVDCHLSADPVAFALVAYSRMSQWEAIARGHLMAWGRKPWKALAFRRLFFNP